MTTPTYEVTRDTCDLSSIRVLQVEPFRLAIPAGPYTDETVVVEVFQVAFIARSYLDVVGLPEGVVTEDSIRIAYHPITKSGKVARRTEETRYTGSEGWIMSAFYEFVQDFHRAHSRLYF